MLQKGIQVFLLIPGVGHSFRQLAAQCGLQRIYPPPISLKQRLRLHLTRCLSHRTAQMRIFSLCGEELAAIVIAYCCLGILLCRTGRHGFPPFAPHMRPTPASCNAFHLIVSGIAICHKTAMEPLQEGCCVLAAAVGLILKVPHRLTAPLAAGIDPHP